MKNFLKVFVLALALVSTSGYGITGMGNGLASCGTWTEERKVGGIVKIVNEAWVIGYLTGVNIWSGGDKDLLINMNTVGLFGWIDNYCKVNPLEAIVDASNALIRVLEQ